jgi:hypothetical protein
MMICRGNPCGCPTEGRGKPCPYKLPEEDRNRRKVGASLALAQRRTHEIQKRNHTSEPRSRTIQRGKVPGISFPIRSDRSRQDMEKYA